MTKQVHIRVEDEVFEALSGYSTDKGQSMQACVSSVIKQMLGKAKDVPSHAKGQYTFIDLFAGIGGMHIAYTAAGAKCVYANEWNKYSQQTYYTNFGIQPDDDITKVVADDIPDHDILVAGFPCQPYPE